MTLTVTWEAWRERTRPLGAAVGVPQHVSGDFVMVGEPYVGLWVANEEGRPLLVWDPSVYPEEGTACVDRASRPSRV